MLLGAWQKRRLENEERSPLSNNATNNNNNNKSYDRSDRNRFKPPPRFAFPRSLRLLLSRIFHVPLSSVQLCPLRDHRSWDQPDPAVLVVAVVIGIVTLLCICNITMPGGLKEKEEQFYGRDARKVTIVPVCCSIIFFWHTFICMRALQTIAPTRQKDLLTMLPVLSPSSFFYLNQRAHLNKSAVETDAIWSCFGLDRWDDIVQIAKTYKKKVLDSKKSQQITEIRALIQKFYNKSRKMYLFV